MREARRAGTKQASAATPTRISEGGCTVADVVVGGHVDECPHFIEPVVLGAPIVLDSRGTDRG